MPPSRALVLLVAVAACSRNGAPGAAAPATAEAPPAAEAGARPAEVEAAAEPIPSEPPPRLARSIRTAGAGRYDLAPALTGQLAGSLLRPLGDPTLHGTLVVLIVEDGAIAGLSLHEVEPLSLFAALGLQSGDIIESINDVAIAGTELGSRDRLLAALGKALQGASDADGPSRVPPEQVRLGVRRGGRRLTLAYQRADDLDDPLADPSRWDEVDPSELDSILVQSIRQRGEHRYDIDGLAFELMLERPELLREGAVATNALENGELVGWKLYAVRPSSLCAALGLQNGDLLLRINGYDLVEQAYDAYMEMAKADELRLEIERAGEALTITYRIVRR